MEAIRQPKPGEVYLGGPDRKQYRTILEVDHWGYVVSEQKETRRRMTRRGLGEHPETRTSRVCCTPIQWAKWVRHAEEVRRG